MQYKSVVLGGTFDRLHKGHFAHLKSAFDAGEHVTIGLTTEVMIKHKELTELIEPYERREQELRAHIKKHWPNKKMSIVPIHDMFGPTLTDPSFEAIAVTPDTKANGYKVIQARNERGLGEMSLIECDLVPAGDGGHLSSTRIRLGQIDRQGKPYRALFGHSLAVPEEHKNALRQPLGTTTGRSAQHVHTAQKAIEIIEKQKPTLIITVGDIVTSTLHERGLYSNISIIDLKSDGKELADIPKPNCYDIKNPAGTIQKLAINIIEESFKEALEKMSSKIIIVDGEEDMLALPCIILAPLNAVVIYGQKDHGIILNFVTEELKEKVRELVVLLEKQ